LNLTAGIVGRYSLRGEEQRLKREEEKAKNKDEKRALEEQAATTGDLSFLDILG